MRENDENGDFSLSLGTNGSCIVWCYDELGVLVHAQSIVLRLWIWIQATWRPSSLRWNQNLLLGLWGDAQSLWLQTAKSSSFFFFTFIALRHAVFCFFLLCVWSSHIVLSVADARVIGWMATGPAAGLEGEPVFSFFFFFFPWTLCSFPTAQARLFQSRTLLSAAYRSSCPIHLCNSLFIAFPCYYIVIRLSSVQYFIVFYCAACPPPKSSAIQPRCFSPNKPV